MLWLVGTDDIKRLIDSRPWSNAQLRRLGDGIRAGEAPGANAPSYNAVIAWYQELTMLVRQRIASEDWYQFIRRRQLAITARAKTFSTLRDKLRRHPDHPLGNIQDLAGVRFEAPMSLSQQDKIAHRIAGIFEQEPSSILDLREKDRSGYRAMHVHLMFRDQHGRARARVEVQVRTLIQGEWANLYEDFADLTGREIRYGVMPENPQLATIVEQVQDLSRVVGKDLENRRNDMETAHVRQRIQISRMLVEDSRGSGAPLSFETASDMHERLLEEQRSIESIEKQYLKSLEMLQQEVRKLQDARRSDQP